MAEQSSGVDRRTVSKHGAIAALAVGAVAASEVAVSADPANAADPWGGYSNGYIPNSALSEIPWKPGKYLRSDAMTALSALNSSFVGAFGYNLPISDAYRDFANQVEAKNYWTGQNDPRAAADPGTSNHG